MPSPEYQGKRWAAWPHVSVSFTFLTLLTVKTDFEPATSWMVELLLLLNGRLSFPSPRKRREHFSRSLFGLFLVATILQWSQKAKPQPYSWQKDITSKGQVRGSGMCNRYKYREALQVFLQMAALILRICITVANRDTSTSQIGAPRFNSFALKRFGSILNLLP